MDIEGLIRFIAEEFGVLTVYGLTAAAAGLFATGLQHLVKLLAILTFVFVAMFRAFDLGQNIDVFHLAERFGLSPVAADGIAAAVFTFGIALAVYGLKRIVLRRGQPAH